MEILTKEARREALAIDAADEAQARELAEQAEQTCLVSASLDLPIETMIEVKTALTPARAQSVGESSGSSAERGELAVDAQLLLLDVPVDHHAVAAVAG